MPWCIECGTSLPPHARFCSGCGAEQAPSEQPSADDTKISTEARPRRARTPWMLVAAGTAVVVLVVIAVGYSGGRTGVTARSSFVEETRAAIIGQWQTTNVSPVGSVTFKADGTGFGGSLIGATGIQDSTFTWTVRSKLDRPLLAVTYSDPGKGAWEWIVLLNRGDLNMWSSPEIESTGDLAAKEPMLILMRIGY